jgi:acyl-coenzyme A synthetase/AMP-(fatty) acid ligase
MANAQADWSPPPPARDDTPVRLGQSSGTTGPVKWFPVSRRAHEGMISERIRNFAMSPQSRQLLTVAFRVRAIFEFVSACLRVGGAIVMADESRWAELLSSAGITHAIFFPIILERILEELPADFAKPANLTLLGLGAHLPPALRERAMARLATSICEIYGTVEAGTISEFWSGDDPYGIVLPRVRVEAVDEQGAPTPAGTPGLIRVQTPLMPVGYLNDPEATARMFRDGWFYPGDIGILDRRGRLRILGRADDLLNIGGRKYVPAVLEELIRGQVAVDDIGVSALPTEAGIDRLWIGFTSAALGESEVAERIASMLTRYGVDAAQVRKLAAIPRNANGKIRRDALKSDLAAAAARG